MSSTLPRRPPPPATIRQHPFEPKPLQQQHPQQPHIPFQRANNAYWTLQLRKPAAAAGGLSPDDAMTHRSTASPRPIEELYSTPNKLRTAVPPIAGAEQLRPTAHGFGHYFSPISKAAAAASAGPTADPAGGTGISPIDPARPGHGFRTSTPTKSSPGDGGQPAVGTPLSSLTDELRHKLHLQQLQQLQQQKLQQQYAEGSYHHHHQQQHNSQSSATSSPLFGSASPLSSGRSTPSFARPQLEPQQTGSTDQLASTSCSDRLGTPKTTLLDFKKLLLSKATGKSAPASKPSAVEQLRLAKAEAAAAAAAVTATAGGTQQLPSASAASIAALNASMNIIDLSGSPKTFANRRMIRQGNFGSPSKSGAAAAAGADGAGADAPTGKHHMSPRTAWKFANAPYRTDVMSTAIPEVHSEEDSSNNTASTGSNASDVTAIDRSAGVAVSPSASQASASDSSDASASEAEAVACAAPSSSGSSAASTASGSSSVAVQADNINLKTNIFLQAEENNFMRGEIGTKSLSRAQMAQARSQFLTGLGAAQAAAAGGGQSAPGSPLMQQHQQQRLAQFKNGHYTGLSPTRTLPTTAALAAASAVASMPQFRAQTEAILDTSGEGAPTPSLETAL